jgi:hypothetical protein
MYMEDLLKLLKTPTTLFFKDLAPSRGNLVNSKVLHEGPKKSRF